MTSITTLLKDINTLATVAHSPNPENLDWLLFTIGEAVRRSLSEPVGSRGPASLRPSNLGRPDRQLWFEINGEKNGFKPSEESQQEVDNRSETADIATATKFLIGHIMEALLIFYVKEAGHKVSHYQERVELDGISGSLDVVIDDVLVDVKTASGWSFKKFADGTIFSDEGKDPFGYRHQIQFYRDAATADPDHEPLFLVFNKENGELCLTPLPKHLENEPTSERIAKVRDILDVTSPPPKKCYEPSEFGKSGNKVLNSNCGFCKWKHACWADANYSAGLRGFKYSDGVKWFTEINNEPRVPEVYVKN